MTKNTLRGLIGVSALAFLLSAVPVLAAGVVDVTGENNTTGADSKNENKYDVNNDLRVDLNNNAKDIENKADVDASTGHNDQNKNTQGGDQTSGAVDATADWETVVNSGASLMGASDGSLDVTGVFTNDTTGADSKNENKLDVDNDVKLDLDNIADIFNKLDFDASTGHNDQNKNTQAGNQTSGDASLATMIANWANNNTGFAGSAGNEVVVDVTGTNDTTGADSKNENKFDVNNKYKLDVYNKADFKNKIDVDTNTGHNDQNKNTQGGDQTSGAADVSVTLENAANNGSSVAGASSSGLDVTGDFTNDTTGANSKNENKLDVKNEVKVDVDNKADIDNKVDVDSDTGHNDQNKNTEAGSQTSGNVEIQINILNEANNG